MEYTNTKYESIKFRDHVRLRPSVYIGSRKSTENTQWVIIKEESKNKLVKQTLSYPVSLYNICDEIILNAIDHCLRTKKLKGKGKCDTIKLSLDSKTGEIICFNNGEGIIVEKNNEGQYYAEMIFTKEMSGSNFSNDNEEKIGANGIGSKATNILSKEFEINTLDAKNKLIYSQLITEGNLNINPPSIKKCKASDSPFTSIRFIPDYQYFFENTELNEEFMKNVVNTLNVILRTRMVYVSAYLGNNYNIFYNDEKININSLEDLALLAVGEENKENIVKCNIKSSTPTSNPPEILVCLWDCENTTEHISFINGLYLSEGGTHIRWTIKHILENTKTKLEKKLKDKIKITSKVISNLLFVFFKGEMIDLEYKNQSKNELSISETRFKDYSMNKKTIDSIWNLLEYICYLQ